MNNLFLILRAVTATVITAKRFELQRFIFPESLFEHLVKKLNNTIENNSSLFFYLKNGQKEWNYPEGSDRVIVNIKFYSQSDYVITTKILVDGVWHSFEWLRNEFFKLDADIINMAMKHAFQYMTNISNTIKIDENFYSIEDIEKYSGTIFYNQMWFTGKFIVTVVTLSINGMEVKILENEKPTENVIIPWTKIYHDFAKPKIRRRIFYVPAPWL